MDKETRDIFESIISKAIEKDLDLSDELTYLKELILTNNTITNSEEIEEMKRAYIERFFGTDEIIENNDNIKEVDNLDNVIKEEKEITIEDLFEEE